jgi:two-component system, NarL family, nitrate/nitrite response regulator NarL
VNASAQLAVLVLAADPLALAGVSALLDGRDDLHITAGGGFEDLRGARLEDEPDVLLLDLGTGDIELPDVGEELPWMVLAPDLPRAREALQAGARGVLLRRLEGDRLAAALLAVGSGLRVLDDEIGEALLGGGPAPRGLDGLPPLTDREMEVLELIALGLSNREIAEELGVSAHTAKFHIGSILTKMDAQTRTEAVVQAARAGVLAI